VSATFDNRIRLTGSSVTGSRGRSCGHFRLAKSQDNHVPDTIRIGSMSGGIFFCVPYDVICGLSGAASKKRIIIVVYLTCLNTCRVKRRGPHNCVANK
jgi:hypothetical protein